MTNKTALRIRSAKKDDARALASLAGELGYPTTSSEIEMRLARIIPDRRYSVFVAENREPIGWIQVCLVQSLEGGAFAEIVGLVVSHDQRRSGLGTQLVEKAVEWAKKNDCLRIRVRTNVVRKEAHTFYTKLGFDFKKTQEVFDKSLE